MSKMSKHSRDRINLQAEIQKKLAQRLSNQFKGDQISVKSKESSLSKTPVYVHQFKTLSKISTPFSPQNMYSNGFQGYFEEKSQYLKSKFDALTLTNNQGQNYVPSSKCNGKNLKYNKCPVHQSRINMKIRGFEAVDKSVIHKLEENYWSNWKPHAKHEAKPPISYIKPPVSYIKAPVSYNKELLSCVKTPVCYIKNPQKAPGFLPQTCIAEESSESIPKTRKSLEFLHKTGDTYETKSSEMLLNVTAPELDGKTNCGEVEKAKIGDTSIAETSNTTLNKHLNVLEPKLSKNLAPHLTISQESSEVEILNTIKHTDSLILTSRKQQKVERPHFQQPKCIKLTRKDPVALFKGSRNFVKGGSYPLKSCLKPDNSSHKKLSLHLGKPGSSLILCVPKKASKKKLRTK